MSITAKQLANAVQIMKLVFQGRGIYERYSVRDVTELAPQVAELFYPTLVSDPQGRASKFSVTILTNKIVEAMVTIKVEVS